MANEWKFKRGPRTTVKVTVGATAVTKGEPLVLDSNLAIAASDGSVVDLVAEHDAAASTELVAILPNGDVFEVDTAADLGMYDRAYMAASYSIDAGSSGNISNMVVVDYNPTSGGLAHVAVFAAPATAYTHTA